MKRVFLLVLGLGFLGLISSCNNDDGGGTPDNVSITGIPATATIKQGETLAVNGVTLSADAGIASFAVSVDGGAAISLAALITVGETDQAVNITFETADLTIGTHTLVFTLTDQAGASATVTHVLLLEDPAPTVIVTGLIDENVTWTADNIYILAGRVVVDEGVTLTIEPGTIIKGEEGDGSLASTLIVSRGGRMEANGTAAAPIIFTSVLDNITIGQTLGSNLTFEDNGLWGGLIVLGNAPISADAVTVQIEGIPADDAFGRYGGSNPNDNSGTINYVSIRHGGTLIGEGNEINGLTLGGVGSGTTITNVEVAANKDDGIEWFGGTVDVTNALVYAADDDAIDVDQAYSGTIDNFIVVAFSGTDHGLEIDGPEGAGMGSFVAQNGTVKGLDDEMADFRDGATGTVTDVYFFNFTNAANNGEGDLELDADGSVDPNDPEERISDNPSNSDNFANGVLVIAGNEFARAATDGGNQTLEEIFDDKWEVGIAPRTDAEAAAQSAANEAKFVDENSLVDNPTVGADASVFAWTFAAQTGALDGI